MNTSKESPAVAPVTKGETYSAIYNRGADVTVPGNWDREKDVNYLNDYLPVGGREELLNRVIFGFEDYQGALTFAFCFLTGQPYELDRCIFRHLPVETKVEILRKLFRQRSQDADYLERFDNDLRRFLDVEKICMPVLEKQALAPEKVWLRELVDVSESFDATVFDFAESMACEHDDCPTFVSVDRIVAPQKLGTNSHRTQSSHDHRNRR